MNWVFIAFCAINIFTFIMMGIDKFKAIHHSWRISEATLISSAFLFGGIGILLGMIVFHHKIRKPKFYILVPIAVILNVALVSYGFLSGILK